MKTSTASATHYDWSAHRNGWHLVNQDRMSVMQERMADGYGEAMHFHQSPRFFFVLSGRLSIELEGEVVDLQSQEGLEVASGMRHRLYNRSGQAADYLVFGN